MHCFRLSLILILIFIILGVLVTSLSRPTSSENKPFPGIRDGQTPDWESLGERTCSFFKSNLTSHFGFHPSLKFSFQFLSVSGILKWELTYFSLIPTLGFHLWSSSLSVTSYPFVSQNLFLKIFVCILSAVFPLFIQLLF